MPELSRRQLIKAAGLTGAGITLAATGFDKHALAAGDALPKEVPNRYWWVKTVDKPTTEIDWKNLKRFEEWKTVRGSINEYRSAEETKRLDQLKKDNMLKWELENVPGYTTKDFALKDAVGAGRPPFYFMGPRSAKTPQERGTPRYEGTPEENARMIRIALRHMGAATVGFVELEPETTRKLVYAEEPKSVKKPILFENVDVGYEDEKKLVIPDKARYTIVYTVQMSNETMKYGPTVLGSQTTTLSYTRLWTILTQIHEFIYGLGYNSYGPTTSNGFGIAPAFGVMAGLGELSRLNRVITPEYGPMVRLTALTTDLPLAPTKPINFGVMDFCKDCMTCAEMCPSKALSLDRDPSWEGRGPWNNPGGHRAYYEDSVKCREFQADCGTNCGICFSSCPYAVDDDASLHRIVKGTIASTSVFNSLLVAGDHKAFPAQSGKPMKDPEGWWKNENLAEMGIDTRRGGRKI
ncbi:MAG: reductive dehalogenase [Desulfitibacter sp. BRH_c19]|nr:MAG: reductive dehalogenase [Desulfitibacter sp. BRH_c19]